MPVDEFEYEEGTFNFNINLSKSGSTEGINRNDSVNLMLRDRYDFKKLDGEPQFVDHYVSPLVYYSDNVTEYYNEIQSSS